MEIGLLIIGFSYFINYYWFTLRLNGAMKSSNKEM
jgi:hypothetical protein